jgi:hypothetical protein
VVEAAVVATSEAEAAFVAVVEEAFAAVVLAAERLIS